MHPQKGRQVKAKKKTVDYRRKGMKGPHSPTVTEGTTRSINVNVPTNRYILENVNKEINKQAKKAAAVAPVDIFKVRLAIYYLMYTMSFFSISEK